MEDCLQSIENGLIGPCMRNPVMRAIVRFADQTIYCQCFVTCLVVWVLYGIVCFAPLFFERDSFLSFHEMDTSWEFYRDALGSGDYIKWLLVSIFVAIPMGLELILDYDQLFDKYEVKEGWLAAFLLIFTFIAPNTVLYGLLEYREAYNIHNDILIARFALDYTQTFAYTIGMMVMMFGHKADYPRNDKHILLNFSVEKRTVNISILNLIGRVLSSVGSGVRIHAIEVVGRAFDIIAAIYVILLTLRMLYMLMVQYLKHGMFLTHHHLSDFMYCITLQLYVLSLLFLRSYYKSNPPTNEQEALNIMLVKLFLQITITCFVQLISGRRNKKLAQIKHDKLETRLNLIRYVSHEVHTPLNTAFMGLTLAIGDLKTWKQKIAHENQSSKQRVEDTDLVLSKDSNNISPREQMIQKLLSMSEDSFNLRSVSSDYDKHSKNNSFRLDGQLSNTSPRAPMSSSEVKDMIDTMGQVNESCKVALSTLDDLLTFDKIDEQKLVIEMQDINPWSFVCAAAKPFAINARQAQVKFSVTLHDRESAWAKRHIIRGDPFKLSQVLRNLISNALKFTPMDGTVEVRLQRDPTFSSKETVRISVTDTGAGISIANQKKLFGQYVQFNAGALQQGKGSGLGLWITKSIVEMHKGHIGVISEGEGMGSMFYVDLPLFRKKSHSVNEPDPGVSRSLRLKPSSGPSQSEIAWDNELNPGEAERPKSARLVADPLGPLAQNLGVSNVNFSSNRVIKKTKSQKRQRKYNQRNEGVLDGEDGGDEGEGETKGRGCWYHMKKYCTIYYTAKETESASSKVLDSDVRSLASDLEAGSVTGSFIWGGMSGRKHSSVFLNNPVKVWLNKYRSSSSMMDSLSVASHSSNESAVNPPSVSPVPRGVAELMSASVDEYEDQNISQTPVEYIGMIPEDQSSLNLSRDSSDHFSVGPAISPQSLHCPSSDLAHLETKIKSKKSTSLFRSMHKSAEGQGTIRPLLFTESRASESDHRIRSTVSLVKLNSSHMDSLYSIPIVKEGDEMGEMEEADHEEGEEENEERDEEEERRETERRETWSSFSSPKRSIASTGRLERKYSTSSEEDNVTVRYSVGGSSNRGSRVRSPGGSAPPFSPASVPSPYESPQNLFRESSNLHPRNNHISKSLDLSQLPSSQPMQNNGNGSPAHVMSRNLSQPLTPPLSQSDRPLSLSLSIDFQPTPSSSAKLSWDRGLKVLVVDDSAPNRKICCKLLSTHRHTVYEACNGLHCLEVCGQHALEQFDLILLDDHMPRMTGPQAASELRKRGYRGVIIGVTGDVYKEGVENFIAQGANQVLPKPLNVDVLRNNVNQLLFQKH